MPKIKMILISFCIVIAMSQYANAKDKFKELVQVPEGKAVVYIIRAFHVMGSPALPMGVFSNQDPVNVLPRSSYCMDTVSPGIYKYWCQTNGASKPCTIEVKEGDLKFIFAWAIAFSELTKEEALVKLKGLREIR